MHKLHGKFLVFRRKKYMTITMDKKLAEYMKENDKKDIVVFTTRCNS